MYVQRIVKVVRFTARAHAKGSYNNNYTDEINSLNKPTVQTYRPRS